MKIKLKKILIVSILIIIILFNINGTLIESNYVYADTTKTQAQLDEDKMFEEKESNGLGDVVMDVIDGVAGLLFYPFKLLIIGIGTAIRVLVGAITAIGGDAVWSVDDILFNKSELTSINFFEIDKNTPDIIQTIRINVATWYYVIRNISIVILLGILIYVGIRMAISTVASDEAKYKKMLKDWVVSIALLFVLHYIMIFTINFNNILVDIVGHTRESVNNRTVGTIGTTIENMTDDDLSNTYDDALNALLANSFSISFSAGFGSAIIYVILVGVTIIFLIMYIKRMLTIGFLIIIAPLITITYSIDKMGDGKSQALNAWLKEFIFNVLIQPFHCIIYVVFADIAMDLVIGDRTLASAVLAIIMIIFIFTAEKIVKKIFNFQASSLGEAIASAGAIATGMSFISKRGKEDEKKGKVGKIPNMKSKGKLNINKDGTGKTGKNPISNNTNNKGKQAENTQENIKHETNETQADNNIGNNNGTVTSSSNSKSKKKKNLKAKATSIAGQLINPLSGFNRRAAAIITMGALGAATGSGKGIVSGMYAGSAADGGIQGLLNRRSANKMVENNEQAFASAYTNYKQKNNLSEKQMQARTKAMLNVDSRMLENMTDDDYEYYSYVRNIQDTYGAIGEDDVDNRVLETAGMIENGDIEPEFDGIEEWTPPQQEQPEPQTENKKSNNTSKRKQQRQKEEEKRQRQAEYEKKRQSELENANKSRKRNSGQGGKKGNGKKKKK
ncbi:MAG: hypothetical protein HFJ20_03595 [Clostridia bacterium]|nr:hypothetical protein [Clostridia bacterium]